MEDMMIGLPPFKEVLPFNHSNYPIPFPKEHQDHLDNHFRYECDNHSLTDHHAHPWTPYQLYRILLDVLLVGLICLLGYAGNTMTIVILLSDQDRKSPTNWLLQSLAVVDIVFLVACMFTQPIKTISEMTDWMSPSIKQAFFYLEAHYLWAFASTAQMITVWVVMLVTVDRYIAICHPLKSKMRTLERAQGATAAVILFSIIYNIPVIMERQIFPLHHPCSEVILNVVKSELGRSTLYFIVYKTICFIVFRAVGPLIVLMTLNVKLVRALFEMRRRHRYMTRSSRQRENVTMTLVVVVSVFVLCELPSVCLRIATTIYEIYVDDLSLDDGVILNNFINPITNALLAFNSAVNFLIYCLVGKKFRRILIKMCSNGCQKEARPEALTYNATASQSQTVNSYALTNLQSNGATTPSQQQQKLLNDIQQQVKNSKMENGSGNGSGNGKDQECREVFLSEVYL